MRANPMNAVAIMKAMNALGGFGVLSIKSLGALMRRPLSRPELIEQIWFVT
jgi:hypothetical protein